MLHKVRLCTESNVYIIAVEAESAVVAWKKAIVSFEENRLEMVISEMDVMQISDLDILASMLAAEKNKVVFVDTEGGFSTERVGQLFPEAKLKNFRILEPTTFEEQSKALDEIKKWVDSGAKLVVIDSIVMLYRLGLKENNVSETNKELARQLSLLSALARKNKIAIIVTNQVYSDFEKRDAVKMVGGDLLKYWSKCIIKLEKVGQSIRKASLVKHRSLPEGSSIFFEICENEIKEAKEPKRKFSLF